MKWLIIMVLAIAGLLLWRMVAGAKRNLPVAGHEAPAFSLQDQHGKTRTLADFRDKWLALYFFPRADTPG